MKTLSPENKFFLIFIATILMIRIVLFIIGVYATNPDTIGLTIFGFRLHHYMYGLILIPFGILLRNLFLYAIGVGLFINELTYLLIRGHTHADNYSWISMAGTVVLIIIVFLLKKYFIFPKE